jgi:diguanylate cyclase (GGDEF)-like protein
MPPAPIPANELERLASLRSYAILDTACEANFDDIARLAARLLGVPIALVSLVDGERQWFKSKIGLDVNETSRDQAFCGYTILDEVPLVVPDATADRRFADNPLVTGDPGIRFYAGVPLVASDGHKLGSLCVIDRQTRKLTDDEVDILSTLARTVMTTMELRRAMMQVRELAMTDALTGLANRPAVLDAVQQAVAQQIAGGSAFTLLYLDLDGFKRVNDLQGHEAGDQVLRAVASVLRDEITPPDMAARIGGDEFIVLAGMEWAHAPIVLAERLRQAMDSAMRQSGWAVTASIGAVLFASPPRDVAEALSVADELMYSAKLAGKDRVMFRVFAQVGAA